MEPKMYVEDPGFKMSGGYLSEEVYSEVLSSLVVVCADIIFVNRASKTFLLATRIAKPIPGPWVIGGRIQAGENPREGACSKVKKETGLELSPERLTYINMYRYLSPVRQQEPQEGGSDTLAYTYAVELRADEIDSVISGLDEKEYDRAKGLRVFAKEDLLKDGIHPALHDMHTEIFGL